MKIKTIIVTIAMMAISAVAFAQDQNNLSNSALASQYKLQIEATKMELKALQAKKKASPDNAQIVRDMAAKKAELKDLQARKKIIDKAVKSDKAKEKAEKAAEKAAAKAEKVEQQLEKAREKAEKAQEKADKAAKKAEEKTAKAVKVA